MQPKTTSPKSAARLNMTFILQALILPSLFISFVHPEVSFGARALDADLSDYAPGEAGQPGGANGEGGAGGRGGVSRQTVRTIKGSDANTRWSVTTDAPDNRDTTIIVNGRTIVGGAGQPGQPGRADGTGGVGGRGGRGGSVIVNGRTIEGEAGQPGRADGTGGAGGRGGVVTVLAPKRLAPPATVPVTVPAVATTPAAIVSPPTRAKRLEFACSTGKDFTVFADPNSPLKSDDGKHNLLRVAAFCPVIPVSEFAKATIADVKACRSEKISPADKACAVEFTELNHPKLDDQKRRFVNAKLVQGRVGIAAKDVAALDKKCGTANGGGEVFKNSNCARLEKILMPTSPSQFKCIARYVKESGMKSATPRQLACYRAVVALQVPTSQVTQTTAKPTINSGKAIN